MRRLADVHPGSTHVFLEGMDREPDAIVWEYARTTAYVIVTKDKDSADMSVLRGHPPKVIWVRIGNCKTSQIRGSLPGPAGNDQGIRGGPNNRFASTDMTAGANSNAARCRGRCGVLPVCAEVARTRGVCSRRAGAGRPRSSGEAPIYGTGLPPRASRSATDPLELWLGPVFTMIAGAARQAPPGEPSQVLGRIAPEARGSHITSCPRRSCEAQRR